MTRIGVISNPLSQRNRRGLDGVRAVLARHPDVLHVELDAVADLDTVLADLARREVDFLVVNGGDGTVQAVLTELCNGAAFAQPPPLAIVSGGMTNLIALDVGLRGRPDKALARLIERAQSGGCEQVRRRLLALTRAPGELPVYGMFFGAAAFYRAVLFTRGKIHSLGAEGSAAAGLALTAMISRILLRRGPTSAQFYQGEDMAIDLDGARQEEESYFLILATTLDRLLLGLMPFWGNGTGHIRYTSVAFPPPKLARALVPVMRGRPKPWMTESGYHSRLTNDVAIATTLPVVLDGEIFHPVATAPIVLRSDREVVFARC